MAAHVQPDTRWLTDDGKVVSWGRVAVSCPGCGEPTRVLVDERSGHHACLTWQPGQPEPHLHPLREAFKAGVTAPASLQLREPEAEERSMFQLLQESITASRKRPVMRINVDDRQRAPWALMVETMRGEHRYRLPAPAGRTVKVMDRVGSYPSAMGNVPVAATALQHTGPIGYTVGHAGIYQVPAFGWDDGPHPLGEIAGQPGDTWWVSTPHLRLCVRLAAARRAPAPAILDSYTGAATTALFKQFSADVSNARADARADASAYGEVKRRSSIAIRGLWPKGARSPFWRPDWSISVRAEASVRHWVRADQAMSAGAELVRLGNVDEVAFLVPARAKPGWVPEPYVEGTSFGHVAVKDTVPAGQWNRARRG